MGSERLIFIIISTGLCMFCSAIIMIKYRLVFPIVLIVAALYGPISASAMSFTFMSASMPMANLLLGFIGAMAVASLIVPKISRVHSPLGDMWGSASKLSRFILIIFLVMICIAVVNTLLEGERAAGTPVAIAIWFFALVGGFSAPDSSEPPIPERWFLFKSVTLALAISLIAVWLIGSGGYIFVILSAMFLTSFAMFISSGSPVYRLATAAIVVICLYALMRFFSSSQSSLAGVLFGGVWMSIALFAQRAGWVARFKRLLAIMVLVSILVLPALTYMLYNNQVKQSGAAGEMVFWGVDSFGETESNLLDRPARWEALLDHIREHPFNLKFTNFQNMTYTQIPDLAEAASPHNIIITLGVFFGIPGITIGCILIIALINSLLEAIANCKPRSLPITIAAFGIVCGFLFSNMWTNALFTWPIETTLFSLAILASWQTLTATKTEKVRIAGSDMEAEGSEGDLVLERGGEKTD